MFRAWGLVVGMGLIFLVSCRPAGDGGAHLVMVDADVPKAGAASSAGISAASAAPADSAPESSAPASAASSASSAASAPKSAASSDSRAVSPSSAPAPAPSSTPSSAGDLAPAAPAPPSQEEAIEAVNAAFDRNNALPQVEFQYIDSLEGGFAQQGKVVYNNCASAPAFDRSLQTADSAGRPIQMEYHCADGRLTCTNGGQPPHEVTYDPAQLPAYVRLLTPRLSAGTLSNVAVSRQSDGRLILQAADSGGGYGDAVVMAGLTAGSAGVTGAFVRYTVGADGYLAASSQDITIHTDSGDRVFHSEKTYVR